MNDEELLVHFHEMLRDEIVGDLSGVLAFEAACALQPEEGYLPPFQQYYGSFFKSPRHVRRTINGYINRRRHVLGFVRHLQAAGTPHPLVLDIGCGFGSDSIFLTLAGCQVVGVDFCQRMIAVARHRVEYWRPQLGGGADPRFLSGYVQEMDLGEPGSFDGVFSSECLHHCEPIEDVLLRMRDLIKDDGAVFILESNAGNPVVALSRRRAVGGRRRLLYRAAGRYRLVGNENIRTTGHWHRLFESCGFSVEQTHYARHLVAELLAARDLDRTLSRLPGASLMCIHTSFELRPAEIE